MGEMDKSKGVKDLIDKGQNNPKGLIGAIALGVIAIGGMAIKAIADSK